MSRTATLAPVDTNSPLTPADLTPFELSRLHLARPGAVTMLHLMPNGKYWIHGPAATACPKCGNVFIGNVGTIRSDVSTHRSLGECAN